ncbi:P22 phage major capsid protein family protein [Psychrobacter pygoscelis]|uniref:P22 phage major capsid protein family protein n=1 Tax=Psychrobacter pygoscelis TaxID=2488563 RepID=UPI00103C1EEE|nr:P22 phage major capsid protein family protein [Psychrobacter pygoscelis]
MAGTGKLTKQEIVAFDDMVEGFEEALVYTQAAKVYPLPSGRVALRGNDTIWRPMPKQIISQEGLNQKGNFVTPTELAAPVSVDRNRSVPFSVHPSELRDESAMKEWGDSAKITLASKVNDALRREAAFYSSIVDVRAGAPTGFRDVATMKAKLDRLGVRGTNRMGFYSSTAMIDMADNLASRQNLIGKTATAYEEAYVNRIAGVSIHEDDSPVWLSASTVTGATIAAANQRHIPTATKKNEVNGNQTNVDNRSMMLTVAKTSGTWKVGDAFTIAGVYAVHDKNKTNTGDLKTFRVIGVESDSRIEVVPAIVAANHPAATASEQAYQNVSDTPANGAAITMLNKRDTAVNTLFVKDALEIVPSTLGLDPRDGWYTTKARLSNGLEVYYSRQGDIDDLSIKCRYDVVFGTALLNPEMGGIQLFEQG